MIRFLFRFAATIALAVAVIMAVLDATRSLAANAFVSTPLATSWEAVSPATLAALQRALAEKVHSAAWDPVAVTVLGLPGYAVFLALAFLLYAVGRRPDRRSGLLPA